jgi:CheY-like chemotaxis protein
MFSTETFNQLDFAEQFQLLQHMAAQPNAAALEDLMHLVANPISDEIIQDIIIQTARTHLQAFPENIPAYLTHKKSAVLRCAVQAITPPLPNHTMPQELLRVVQDAEDISLQLDILHLLENGIPETLRASFRELIQHPNSLIAGKACQTLGLWKDTDSIPALAALIHALNEQSSGLQCDYVLACALQALGEIGNEAAIALLTKHLHHVNATARRIIHQSLLQNPDLMLAELSAKLEAFDMDECIMALNLLGFSSDERAFDILKRLPDLPLFQKDNIRFAYYEALGRLKHKSASALLLAGTKETNELTIVAVFKSLEAHMNPGILMQLRKQFKESQEHSQHMVRGFLTSKCESLFDQLYKDRSLAGLMVQTLLKLKDPELARFFSKKIQSRPEEWVQGHLQELGGLQGGSRRGKILVVDDSQTMLHYYQVLAGGLGFDVVTAENGQEGLSTLQREMGFDLIVSDMNMPVMDGIEMVEKLRENPFLETIPVLLVTTEREESQKEQARSAGVNAFLSKPFTPEQFEQHLTQLLAATPSH